MNAADLSMIAGAILSLIFSYLPGLNEKFNVLKPEHKRLIMLGMIVVVTGGIYLISCAGYGEQIGYVIRCDQSGWIELIKVIIMAAVANQGTYNLTKR